MDQRRHDAPVDHARRRETAYPKGVSVYNVPDMANPGKPRPRDDPGRRRADVLLHQRAERAADVLPRPRVRHHPPQRVRRRGAGYLLQDDAETGPGRRAGLIPGCWTSIPLVIQDKTFVDATTIGAHGPDLELGDRGAGTTRTPATPVTRGAEDGRPLVAARLHAGAEPVRPLGRQRDGPLALRSLVLARPRPIPYGPVPNPYYDPRASTRPGSRPRCPGTPNPSWGAEAFLDTPVINGTAYPTLTVEPKAYRFRILNAAQRPLLEPAALRRGRQELADHGGHDRRRALRRVHDAVPLADCTEVKMVPAAPEHRACPPNWPPDGREGGVPDPDHGRPRLHPDRHRGRLPADAGGGPDPADRLEHEPD